MDKNPFDKLDEFTGVREQIHVDGEEDLPPQGGAPAPPPPPPKLGEEGGAPELSRNWDFRHSKMPEGVTIIGDEMGEAKLEVQQDRSTALVVPPKSYLKFDCA